MSTITSFLKAAMTCPPIKRRLLLLATVAGLLTQVQVSVAEGAFFQNTYGLPGPHSTITFAEKTFPDGTAFTTEYADLGITISPFAYYFASPGAITSAPNFDVPIGTSFIPNGPASGVREIRFTQPQREAAFTFGTYNGAVATFQALLNGNVVESASAPVGTLVPNFYGFRDITFDAIRISTNTWPAWAIDNVQFQKYQWVPTSTTSDCTGHDRAGVSDGALPASSQCHATTAGLAAICWDQVTHTNPGLADPACTYKSLTPAACTGGSTPGVVYACQAVDPGPLPEESINISHSGAADPVTEGFRIGQQLGPSTPVPLTNDLGRDAWSITSIFRSSQWWYYSGPLTAAQRGGIAKNGAVLSFEARVVRGLAPAFDAGNRTTIGGATLDTGFRRFDVLLGIDSNGDTVVTLSTMSEPCGYQGSNCTAGPSFTLTGSGSSYHNYRLVVERGGEVADLFVDGIERISDYTGGDMRWVASWGLAFGVHSGGTANYANVTLTSTHTPVMDGSLTLPSTHDVTIEQGTQTITYFRITNRGTVARSATLEIVNPHSGLTIDIPQPTLAIGPGETKTVSTRIDTGTLPAGSYDSIIRVRVDDGSTFYPGLSIKIVPQGKASLPDLSISSSDISFTPKTGNEVALTAVIHNKGSVQATNVRVRFLEFDTVLGETVIALLPADGLVRTSITVPMAASGDHLITVLVDPAGSIEELDITNNEASKVIHMGSPSGATAGSLLLTGSLPSTVYTSFIFDISGSALYDIYLNGVRYNDYVVKGGSVKIRITGDGGAEWLYGDIYTDVKGNFTKFLQAPPSPGTYHINMTVTDNTFSASRDFVLNVTDPPPTPITPPLPPPGWWQGGWEPEPHPGDIWRWIFKWIKPPPEGQDLESDVWLYSRDIGFSKDNPAAEEEIKLFAEIHYWANSTALLARDVPVNFYAKYPGQPREKVGQVTIKTLSVGVPYFGSRHVYSTWKNQGQGIYMIEVEIDEEYAEENKANNAATRAIMVGQLQSQQGVLSGQVTNAWGAVGNVTIRVLSGAGIFASTTTDNNGFYHVGNLPPGSMQVEIVPPAGYVPDAAIKPVTIASHSVSVVDFLLSEPRDIEPPMLTLPSDISAEATGPAGVPVTFTVSATDAVDGAVIPTCAPASGSTFAIGATSVTCSATDKAGNTASGSFKVIVSQKAAKCGDYNGDSAVDTTDYAIFKNALGKAAGQPGYNAAADMNGDGAVSIRDYPAWYACYLQYRR